MLKKVSILNMRILVVLIATLIAFSPIFKAGFVNYDDPEHIINNPYIQNTSISNIKAIWSGEACVLYVPVTTCSYYLDVLLGGRAVEFHGVNLLFHLLNVILLYLLFLALRVPVLLTLFVLIFFALNPVVTESVCWITERKDVLYTFFLLCAAIFFLKDHQQTSRRYYFASLILFSLSCLSKPMAVSFPLVIAAYLYAHGSLKPNLLKLLPFVLVALLISFITYYFIIIKNGPIAKTNFSDYSCYQKSFLFMSQTGFYFARHLWPVNISLFHFFPDTSELYSFKTLLFFTVGLGYVFCLYHFRYNKRTIALLVAWLILLLPVMQIVPNSQSYVNERYFYLTFTLPVYFIGRLLLKHLSKNGFIFISNLLLFVFAFLTFKQSQYWKDTETLFKYEYSLDSKNSKILNVLGYYYNSIGEFDKAKSYLEQALQTDSTNASSLNNYGLYLCGIGRPDSAITFLKSAILHKRNYLEAHNNLGLCYLRCGENEKAIGEFKMAETIDPTQLDVMFNLGIVYFFDGQKQRGVVYLKNAAAKKHKRAVEFIDKYKLYFTP